MAERRIKKWVIKGIILFLGWIILAINAPKVHTPRPPLQGTYLSDKLPFASITFVEQDNHTFIFDNYILSETGKISRELDEGTYTKKTDRIYLINSAKFKKVEILYNGKDRSFKIKIDGGTYLFKQSSPTPIINLTNYE